MKKKIVFVLSIIVIFIKIYMIYELPINSRWDLPYDDGLILKLSNNLINGHYLGKFDYMTLIKGIGAPLFVASSYLLHIPFLVAQELLYIGACILCVNMLKNVIKNKYILCFIFIILIFNPITYSTELTRVYRDGIYTSFILYFLSLTYLIYFNRKKETKKLINYFIGLGIVISCIYNTREETIWLFPFALLSTLITMVFVLNDKNIFDKKVKICLYLIPICILCIVNLTICTLNYKYYNAFTLNQYWGKEFREMYGALTRITPDKRIIKVPITRNSMKKAYEVSSKFKALEDFYENQYKVEFGKFWESCDTTDIIPNEITGGYIHWALMDGISQLGYYIDARSSNNFFKNMANEINIAIDNGEIEGLSSKRVSNSDIIEWNDIPKIFYKIFECIKYQMCMNNVKVKVDKEEAYIFFIDENGDINGDIENFSKITRTKIVDKNSYTNGKEKNIVEFLEKITVIYKTINPFLFVISLILYGFICIAFINGYKNLYNEFLLLNGLLCVYLSRILIVSYTASQMFSNALNVMYLSSIYSIQYLFSYLSIYFFFTIKNAKKGRINERKKI